MLGTAWFTHYVLELLHTIVTNVMEFTEDWLTVFWTYVHALLYVYFWLLGDHVDLKNKRLHFQSDFYLRELALCSIICM